MLQILVGLLAKTLNKPEDEIKSLILKEDSEELKPDALSIMLDLDASRMSTLVEAHKKEKADQYARALKEVSKDWEKKIKDQFSLETDKTGDELIAEAVQSKASGGGDGDGDELTDEKVKSHPLYIRLENEKKRELEEVRKEWEKKLDEKENEYTQRMTRSSVHQKILARIKSKNPVLPEDAKKAEKRLNAALRDFSEYDFDIDGNDIIVKTKDGQQLKDKHNNPVSFEELVDVVADDYFDFDGSGGDSGGKGSGSGTGNKNEFGSGKFDRVVSPKTPDELKEAIRNAKSSEEREAITAAWEKNQGKSE